MSKPLQELKPYDTFLYKLKDGYYIGHVLSTSKSNLDYKNIWSSTGHFESRRVCIIIDQPSINLLFKNGPFIYECYICTAYADDVLKEVQYRHPEFFL